MVEKEGADQAGFGSFAGDEQPTKNKKKGDFKPTTANGYELGEVAFALQKCIRRGGEKGMEELAMYWALEMIASGYFDYCWRRMIIIASEDIGIADPFCAVMVGQLYENAKISLGNQKKNELNDQVEPLQQAILYMCRTQKTRYGDDFMCYVNTRRNRGWKPEIPDIALDMHTARGRAKGRGELYFCSEGSKVVPEVKIEGPNYLLRYCRLCASSSKCSKMREIEARGE